MKITHQEKDTGQVSHLGNPWSLPGWGPKLTLVWLWLSLGTPLIPLESQDLA